MKIDSQFDWFKVHCTLAHKGAGSNSSSREGIVYIFAKDVIHALNKYKRIGGVHRDKVPSISKISENEAKNLEDEILKYGKNTLTRARGYCYMYNR